jgi:nucleotide-binding universal stress UspA family protein
MKIRAILAGASGGAASTPTVELACQLATRFEAHLECHHVRMDPRDFVVAASYGAFGMVLDGAWIDEMETEAQAAADRTKRKVLEIIERRGIATLSTPPKSTASAAWRVDIGHPSVLIPRRARFFDLTVLGHSDRVVKEAYTDVIEQTLLHSGRPVLLAPVEQAGMIGKDVAIGWNGSPAAVHALQAAMPFLERAARILLVTVGDRHKESVDNVKEYLGWHSIGAELHHLEISGAGAGHQLLDLARDKGCDMLVMGAFSHTPWRELLFGGATRDVVATMGLPVLLTH